MKNNKTSLLSWALILIPNIIAVALFFLVPTTAGIFSPINATLIVLGQLAGIIGAILMSINLVLSTRLPVIDRIFKGINNAYARHGQIGQIAMILTLMHPLLLLPKYATGVSDAASFLFLSSNWATNFGILALWLMVLLVVLTLYLRPKYHVWKFTHQFMGASFLLVGLHVWLTQSTALQYLPLKAFMLTMISLGLIAFAYKTLFGSILVKKLVYRVENIRDLSDEIVEIILSPMDKQLSFNPGQFAFISFYGNNISAESHPFSITSSPTDRLLRLTVKKLGDYTKLINNLRVGAVAEIEGPFGHFTHKNAQNRSQIWVAGGIGITPFISMARSLNPNDVDTIDLYYCTRDEKDLVYISELEQISKILQDKLRVISFCSIIKGRISADLISETSGNLSNKDIYICAPQSMISSLKDQFRFKGVLDKFMHSEEFGF